MTILFSFWMCLLKQQGRPKQVTPYRVATPPLKSSKVLFFLKDSPLLYSKKVKN